MKFYLIKSINLKKTTQISKIAYNKLSFPLSLGRCGFLLRNKLQTLFCGE